MRALRLASGVLLASAACSDQPQFGDAATSAASTTATTSAVSASSSSSTAPSTSAGEGAGGSDGGAGPASGGGTGEGGAGAAGGGGGPCDALHVAPGGDDDATGCEDAPMATITAALARAGADGFDTVLVCAGTFQEELVLGVVPLTVRGGFDCRTWDGRNAEPTRITAPPLVTTTVTLVADASVTLEDVTIDGPILSLQGALDAASVGLRVDGGDHVLRDVTVFGGTASPTVGSGSIAISLLGTTSLLERVVATGGTGVSVDTAGSIGIQVEGGAPRLHVVTVSGGAGVGPIGSLGVVVSQADLTGDATIISLAVDGGTGRVTDDGALATAGLALVNGGIAQIENSLLGGGNGALANRNLPACGTGDRPNLEAFALIMDPGTSASVVRSRLFGGNSDGTGADAHITGAVRVNDATLKVDDSLLVTGSSDPADACYFTARGIWMLGTAQVDISESTIVARAPGDTTAIWNDAPAGGLAVDGSLLVSLPEGDGLGRTVVWNWADCQASPPDLSSFMSNALVPRSILAQWCGGLDTQDMPALIEVMPAATPRDGTFEVRFTCSSGDCIVVPACVDPGDCLEALFANEWEADGGYDALFLGGLEPGPLVPCRIAQGGAIDANCTGLDAIAAGRSSPCSIGGREIDDACP